MPQIREIISTGSGKTVIYWGVSAEHGESAAALSEEVKRLMPNADMRLVSYAVDDWNAEFSPWAGRDSKGLPVFDGKGSNTAKWLIEEGIPQTEKEVQAEKRFIIGYSLSGLFSLWSFYETGVFNACASCSGSLWFENWETYAETAKAPAKSAVYLSLGGKEARTSDPMISQIEELTRKQDKLSAKDVNIGAHTLEMNPGGHFADPVKRMAKAVVWLLKNA